MNKKDIVKLVELYFNNNPNFKNKGIGYRIKTYDIIEKYNKEFKKTYKEIEECINLYKYSDEPIWNILYNYFFKSNKNKKSNYKDSITDSTNIDDWI